MGKLKALGPDGFIPGFYQHFCGKVGPSIVEFVLSFLNSGILKKRGVAVNLRCARCNHSDETLEYVFFLLSLGTKGVERINAGA